MEVIGKRYRALTNNINESLFLFRKIVTHTEQEKIMQYIDKNEWSHQLRRRVQHYGFIYDYRKRRITHSANTYKVPEWGYEIFRLLFQISGVEQEFNQLIVNEYLPGQGIGAHIDSPVCFDNYIFSLSLGSSCIIEFTLDQFKYEVLLEPGDLLLLKDDARYNWRHGIKGRKKDVWEGRTFSRGRRLSLTFRNVLSK